MGIDTWVFHFIKRQTASVKFKKKIILNNKPSFCERVRTFHKRQKSIHFKTQSWLFIVANEDTLCLINSFMQSTALLVSLS